MYGSHGTTPGVRVSNNNPIWISTLKTVRENFIVVSITHQIVSVLRALHVEIRVKYCSMSGH